MTISDTTFYVGYFDRTNNRIYLIQNNGSWYLEEYKITNSDALIEAYEASI